MPNEVFFKLDEQLGKFEVDLFASRLTHKLSRYCSWLPDPFAEQSDVFLTLEGTKILCVSSFQCYVESGKEGLDQERERGHLNYGLEIIASVSKAGESCANVQTGESATNQPNHERGIVGRPCCMEDIKDKLVFEGLDIKSAERGRGYLQRSNNMTLTLRNGLYLV